jgi:hypothetical protein
MNALATYKKRAGVELPTVNLNQASARSAERKKKREHINRARKIVKLRFNRDNRRGKLAEVLAVMGDTDG